MLLSNAAANAGKLLAEENRRLVIQSVLIGWEADGFGVYPPILPYAREDVRTATYLLGSDAYLFQVHPHMHLRGSWMTYEAIAPSGAREALLSVPQFHAHWQTMYRFTQPKRLPAGTTIRITGAFDNSPQNEHNPAPSQTVNWGQQLQDEMFLGGIHFAETLTIRTQPRSQNVARGGPATFSVSATTANAPLRYQWHFNGAAIPGATNSSLQLNNVQPANAGNYTAAVADQTETVLSQPATLTVGERPVITLQPQSHTAVVGSDVTFSVTASGTLPLWFRWRNPITITNMILQTNTSFLTIPNVQFNTPSNYTVVVSNLFGSSPASSNAVLTVVAP